MPRAICSVRCRRHRLPTGDLRMPLPVASLANSTYVLRIEATAGDETTQQWIAFRVAR